MKPGAHPGAALSALDLARLHEALALAETAIGVSDPNPRVGCVIGHADGRVLARGATQAAGQAHAEAMALRDAVAQGQDLRGATAWVTLEPCAHHGRTPPCCDALVAAGLARVVVAAVDPFAAVNGAGIERLRAAGIQVDIAEGAVAEAARDINIGFLHRVQHGRPWVRLKVAVSLDGRTALADGRSQWITGPEARADGHAWRRRAGAVLTGLGTVLADDPRLDVRLVPTQLQPLRVVLDTQGRTPATARVLQPPGRVLVVGAQFAHTRPQDRLHEAPAARAGTAADAAAGAAADGIERLQLPAIDGQPSLPALLDELGRRQVNELHVEAGATLNGALLRQGLVDELLVYMAPVLLGEGRPLARLPPLAGLPNAARWRFTSTAMLGADMRLLARPLC